MALADQVGGGDWGMRSVGLGATPKQGGDAASVGPAVSPARCIRNRTHALRPPFSTSVRRGISASREVTPGKAKTSGGRRGKIEVPTIKCTCASVFHVRPIAPAHAQRRPSVQHQDLGADVMTQEVACGLEPH